MKISIASGKGGTGKTFVATNLALSLEKKNVLFLDCDVEEPNAHFFLKPQLNKTTTVYQKVPTIDKSKCTLCGACSNFCKFNALATTKKGVVVFPSLCHGCGGCKYACPEHAISERNHELGKLKEGLSGQIRVLYGELKPGEPMATPLIRALKKMIGDENIVIIDSPPGTACPMVNTVQDTDFCILVTEPTPFGLHDLTLAIDTLNKLGIPHGVVINKYGIGNKDVEAFCAEKKIPILLKINFDRKIAEIYSNGVPLVDFDSTFKKPMLELFEEVRGRVK